MPFLTRFTKIFFLIIISFQINIVAQESTLEYARSLPNPRSQNSTWILDQSKILETAGAKESLNQILEKLEKDTTNEIALVILPSIGNLDPKNLATEIFQTWGIGKLGKDNGVLILHVLDQRRIEIEVGYGLEGILTDVVCKRLLEEKTIPYFKTGAFSTGHENLLRTMSRILLTPKESPIKVLDSFTSKLPVPEKAIVDIIPEDVSPFLDSEYEIKNTWRIRSIYLLMSGIFLAFLFRFLLYTTSSYWKTKYKLSSQRRETYLNWSVLVHGSMVILCTIGMAGLLYSFFGSENLVFFIVVPGILFTGITAFFTDKMFIKWDESLAHSPIICSKCRSKSDEITDRTDIYKLLSEEEKFEQSLGVFQYKIYECNKCRNISKDSIPVENHKHYTNCTNCSRRTAKSSYKVLVESTTQSGGVEEITVTCAYCKFTSVSKNVTSKIYQSTNSGNSSSSSATTAKPSSSSSSNSSSTSDKFGGGSSGGGGAGSSY
ncbi:MAG: TPM domain-containing protein [Leptospiraceae bacterium]|nr:TPM domain-containing protein [Leptospiraceae bacterium]